ncbi:Lrp/AsnC family transcriptional regulator [Leucobacter sp. CSA2]|uniref:Lrp/AsnC family transcriptional regulator n=1 Tax=Leucobacter edaphi TaxID=2796472 RepID=A0A934QAM5_9MICO|nr:Lrp/AsnC family transcriptional regulator [Leucobacter edaphi]
MNTIPLSETDLNIVAALAQDSSVPYKELAARVGLAVSTCHARVRALESRGVITRYRAEFDQEAVGRGVNALVQVRVHSQDRHSIPDLARELRSVRGVQQVFLIGGDRDIMVHLACASVPALRDLVAETFGENPSFAQTQTQIVFEHLPGELPV